jgi:hypothetical protein
MAVRGGYKHIVQNTSGTYRIGVRAMPLFTLAANIPLLTPVVNFAGRSWLTFLGTTAVVGTTATAVVKHKAIGDYFCSRRVENAKAKLETEIDVQRKFNQELHKDLVAQRTATENVKLEVAAQAQRIKDLSSENEVLATQAAKVEAAIRGENEARKKEMEAQHRLSEARAREENVRKELNHLMNKNDQPEGQVRSETPRPSNAARPPPRRKAPLAPAKGGKAPTTHASARTGRRKSRGERAQRA